MEDGRIEGYVEEDGRDDEVEDEEDGLHLGGGYQGRGDSLTPWRILTKESIPSAYSPDRLVPPIWSWTYPITEELKETLKAESSIERGRLFLLGGQVCPADDDGADLIRGTQTKLERF